MTKVANWTDELKQEAKHMYIERISQYDEEDRPAHSTEVCTQIGVELGFTPNSIRSTIMRMKNDDGSAVYVRAVKTPKAKEGGAKRVSKADAHQELSSALADLGAEMPEDFAEQIKSMTGKSAQLIAELIRSAEVA